MRKSLKNWPPMDSNALKITLPILFLITFSQNSQNPWKDEKHPFLKQLQSDRSHQKILEQGSIAHVIDFISRAMLLAHLYHVRYNARMFCVSILVTLFFLLPFSANFHEVPISSFLVIFASSSGLYISHFLLFDWFFSDSSTKCM